LEKIFRKINLIRLIRFKNPLTALNFGERSLVYRRILPPKKVAEHHINHQWLFVPNWLSPDKDDNESV
jgi:hypothetical protein